MYSYKNKTSGVPCLRKGSRGVRFEGCYSLGSVIASHKGVQLTSLGVGILHQLWGVR